MIERMIWETEEAVFGRFRPYLEDGDDEELYYTECGQWVGNPLGGMPSGDWKFNPFR